MKQSIEILTTLLICSVMLLAGCSGCAQKTEPQPEVIDTDVEKEDTYKSPFLFEVDPNAENDTDSAESPPIPRDQLPDTLPSTLTLENYDIWTALVKEAAKDPEYLQQLLSDINTVEEANKTVQILVNTNVTIDESNVFIGEMWRKMYKLYPNDGYVVYEYITYYAHAGYRSTRAEQEHFVKTWEHLKKLNDADGLSPGHPRRQAHSLTIVYMLLHDYDKALENVREDIKYAEAAKAEFHLHGGHEQFLTSGLILNEQEVLENKELYETKQKQGNTENK